MFEFARNEPVEASALADLFGRIGWREEQPAVKLEWAMRASEDWVTCRVEGELVGFGRTYRLDAVHKLVFDVVVDERFAEYGVADEIVRRLALGGDDLQEVAIYRHEDVLGTGMISVRRSLRVDAPEAPPGAYLG